jgi:RNA polymerase sigma-70 factor (ECF subfamily)
LTALATASVLELVLATATATATATVKLDAEAEFSALFREMASELRAYVLRRGGQESVDDVIAETFVVVWTRWYQLPVDPSARRGWVYGVVKNKLAQALLARERRRRLVARMGTTPIAVVTEPHAQVSAAERVRLVLDRLTVAEREAVVLTVVAGLSASEAAEALDCSISVVTTRVSRARRRLRRLPADSDTDGSRNE